MLRQGMNGNRWFSDTDTVRLSPSPTLRTCFVEACGEFIEPGERQPLSFPKLARTIRAVKASLLLLLLLSFAFEVHAADPAGKGPKPGALKIRVSQSAINTRSAVLWVAQEQGLFARYGL